MAVPLMRKYNHASTAVDTFALSTDALTGLTVQQLNRDNVILDMVSSIQPTGAELYEVRVLVNGLEAGVTFFSSASDPGSSGRVIPGPIPIQVAGSAGGKQLAYNTAQTATGAGQAAYSFLLKYANLF
jgi:hypothetical protein